MAKVKGRKKFSESQTLLKISKVLMSMQDKKLVGDIHDISLTLFRDVFAVPEI